MPTIQAGMPKSLSLTEFICLIPPVLAICLAPMLHLHSSQSPSVSSIVACIVTSLPLTLRNLYDIALNGVGNSHDVFSRSLSFWRMCTKAIPSIVILVPNIILCTKSLQQGSTVVLAVFDGQMIVISHIVLMTAFFSDFELSWGDSTETQPKLTEIIYSIILSAFNSGALLVWFTFHQNLVAVVPLVCIILGVTGRVLLIFKMWWKNQSKAVSSENSTNCRSEQESELHSCCWYALYMLIICSQWFFSQRVGDCVCPGYVIIFLVLMIFIFNDYNPMDTEKLVSAAAEMNRIFVRYISHELRSHVSHLSMGLEQLGDEFSPSHIVAHKMIDELQDSCDSSLQILNDILIIDELHKKTIVRHVDVKSVKTIVRRSILAMKSLLNLREIDIVADVKTLRNGPPCYFSANVDEIAHVLRYLIGNAAKCSEPGESISLFAGIVEVESVLSSRDWVHKALSMPSLRSSMTSVHVGDLTGIESLQYELVFRVVDTGIGMSTEDKEAIFVEQGGNGMMSDVLRGGVATGMIFPVVKAMVERNGGTLTVESAGRGLGCTCSLTLPLLTTADQNLNDILCGEFSMGGVAVDGESLTEHKQRVGDMEPHGKILPALWEDLSGDALRSSPDVLKARSPVNTVEPMRDPGFDPLLLETDLEAQQGRSNSTAIDVIETSFIAVPTIALILPPCLPIASPEIVMQLAVASRPGQEWSAFIYHNLSAQLERVYPRTDTGPPSVLQLDDITAGATVLSQEIIIFPWTNKSSLNVLSNAADGGEFTSVLAGPVIHSDGRMLGVIEAVNIDRSAPFTAVDEEFMASLCQQMRHSFAAFEPVIPAYVKHSATVFKKPTVSNYYDMGQSNGLRANQARRKLHNFRTCFKATTKLKSLRFLAVGEHSTSHRVLVHMLRKMLGHSADEVSNGVEALAMVEQAQSSIRPYAAVFVDRQVPGMDGPTLVRLMREQGFAGRVVCLTDAGADQDVDICLKNGASIVLEKPLILPLVMMVVDGIQETSTPALLKKVLPRKPHTASTSSLPGLHFIDDSLKLSSACEGGEIFGNKVTASVPASSSGLKIVTLVAPFNEAPLRILVVDDVNSSRKLLAYMLTSLMLGEAEEAIDSAVALSRVQMAMQAGRPFDIVFLTYITPILDGPSTARQMKAMGFTGQIVGLAGLNDKDRLEYAANGVTTVLEHPVKLPRLREILTDYVKSAGILTSTQLAKNLIGDIDVPSSCAINDNDNGSNSGNSGEPIAAISCTAEDTRSAVSASAGLVPSMHFLVVDDVPSNRKILSRGFTKLGHSVVEAIDGVNALEHFTASLKENRPFHAVFMDFVMPNMDGPAATAALRRLGYMGPIYGVTGNVLEADVKHFMTCGATRVVPKPMNKDTLAKMLAEIQQLH